MSNDGTYDKDNIANYAMITGQILMCTLILFFIISVLLIIFYNKIDNKINILAIVLIVFIVLFLLSSIVLVLSRIEKKQKNFSNKKKNSTCENYSNYLYDRYPSAEWAELTTSIISIVFLIIGSCASLIFFKPLENKLLYPIFVIALILYVVGFLICHKFNQCILKRYSYPPTPCPSSSVNGNN